MKKLVLLLAVVFSVSLFSCGNANKDAQANDSDSIATIDSTATDSTATDSVAPADSATTDSTAAPVAQ